VLAASGVALYATLESGRAPFLVLALGVASVIVLGGGLAAAGSGPVFIGLAGLAASWSVSAWTRGAVAPGGTMLAAAAIFGVAELAYWSLEQVSVPDELELVARRAAGLAVRVAGAVVIGALLLAAIGLRARGGLLLEAVGVAAVVGLLALVVTLAQAGHGTHER
jgi:hypothetical protein